MIANTIETCIRCGAGLDAGAGEGPAESVVESDGRRGPICEPCYLESVVALCTRCGALFCQSPGLARGRCAACQSTEVQSWT